MLVPYVLIQAAGYSAAAAGAALLPFALVLALASPNADYWEAIFPAIVVIAIGMTGAVAPLTTAVLASVDNQHVGSASGLNSAVARIGGMVAIALLGGVLSASGPALIDAFHQAAIVCALASGAASLSAFSLVAIRP